MVIKKTSQKSRLKKRIKKTKYNILSHEEENLKSWLLYSLRFALLDKNVRNKILESSQWFGKFKKMGFKIILGDIYGEGIGDMELESLISKYTSMGDDKIVLFTLSNNPRNTTDPNKHETHFQSFILINKINTIFAFDPAMSTNIPVNISPEQLFK